MALGRVKVWDTRSHVQQHTNSDSRHVCITPELTDAREVLGGISFRHGQQQRVQQLSHWRLKLKLALRYELDD